jgi:hypothetical protein
MGFAQFIYFYRMSPATFYALEDDERQALTIWMNRQNQQK